jgi:hypothetical protein
VILSSKTELKIAKGGCMGLRYRMRSALLIILMILAIIALSPALFAQDGSQGGAENGADDSSQGGAQDGGNGGTGEYEPVRFQEPYSRGDQIFTISGGLFFPLFFQFPNADQLDNTESVESAAGQLSLGGIGSLGWSSFVTNRFFLGIDLSGTFTLDPNKKVQMLLPLTMKAGYLFLAGSFEFPVSIEAGIAMNSYNESTYFGPIIKPAASAYWVMDAAWGFGLNVKYWWVPEIYFGEKASETAIGNFTEVTLSARYRF